VPLNQAIFPKDIDGKPVHIQAVVNVDPDTGLPSFGGTGGGAVGIDQTTQGTTNGVYPLETADIISLTLSLDTVAYGNGDVLADTQEMAGVMRANGKTARLDSLVVIDADDQGQPMDIYFLKSNVSLGTENAAPSITDANALEILGKVSVYSTDFSDLGGVRVALPDFKPFMLQSGAASTSIYVAAISKGTGTYTASGVTIKAGIVRM